MIHLTVGQCIELVFWNVDLGLSLAPQGHDGLARVTADDGDDGLCRVLLSGIALDKGLGTNDIKSSDAEKLLRVEDAGGLKHLGSDRNSAVDGVGNDKEVCVGTVLGNTLDEVANNACVDLEQIITGHARLPYTL